MGVYRYRALGPNGSASEGELIADSEPQVRAMLRTAGLLPQRITAIRQHTRSASSRSRIPAWSRLAQGYRRRRAMAVGSECFEGLSALLTAGVPLAEALETLAKKRKGLDRTASMLRVLAERIRGGGDLADAMTDQPEWFSPVEVELVRVAHQSGELAETLRDLARDRAQRSDLMQRLAGALAYPALLIAFGIGVVVFLTTTTLPQLAGILLENEVALPASTKVLLAIGSAFTTHTLWVILGVLLIAAALAFAGWHPALSAARLRVPMIGGLVRRAQVAAACGLLARLLRGGIQFTEALRLVSPTIRNRTVLEGFVAIGTSLRTTGEMPAIDEGLFEPVVERLLLVGDESGELAGALELIAQRESDSVGRAIKRLSAALEPLAILLVAGLVGFVVLAALTPMLRLTQTL